MIVDFQHHFVPRELAKEPAGTKTAIRFDKDGVPSMTPNSVLYDLDEHIRMMDAAGIDAAFLTSPPGMCVDTELSRLINDKTNNQKTDVPSVFLKPITVTTANMNDTVVKDKAVKVTQLCTGSFKSECTAAGISG